MAYPSHTGGRKGERQREGSVFDASNYWITVVELPQFEASASAILTAEEIEGLIAYVAQKPDDGRVLLDTGGLRSLKWPACRRNGATLVYYFRDLNMPVYLLTVLEPGERCRFTKAEKAMMRALVDDIVAEQWRSQVAPLVTSNLHPIR